MPSSLFTGSVQPSWDWTDMMQAGVCEVCITPPIGVELAGYGPRIDRYSTDIHDPLMAQVLVLDDGTQRCALAVLDVMGFGRAFTAAVRQQIADRTRIPAENIMVACTHSHTTPTLTPSRDWGMPDEPYVAMLVRHLTGAATAAEHRLTPVRIKVCSGEHHELAWNRTSETLTDPTVTVLMLESLQGKPMALIVHYACHPVMLGPRSQISADYPGALRRHLQNRYPGSVVLFVNGACGDIDPVSNREVWGQATFEDVEAAGQALGRTVEAALEQSEAVIPDLHISHGQMTLPYQVPTLDEVQQQIRLYEAEAGQDETHSEKFEDVTSSVRIPRFWLRFWRDMEKRLQNGIQTDAETFELQAISIGKDLVLVAAPAEVYTRQGMAIRQFSPDARTMLICYANDLCGYIPPREAYETGSYAAVLAAAVYDRLPFQPHVSDILLEQVRLLLSHRTRPSH